MRAKSFTFLNPEHFAIFNMNNLCTKNERSSYFDPKFWLITLDTVVYSLTQNSQNLNFVQFHILVPLNLWLKSLMHNVSAAYSL